MDLAETYDPVAMVREARRLVAEAHRIYEAGMSHDCDNDRIQRDHAQITARCALAGQLLHLTVAP